MVILIVIGPVLEAVSFFLSSSLPGLLYGDWSCFSCSLCFLFLMGRYIPSEYMVVLETLLVIAYPYVI